MLAGRRPVCQGHYRKDQDMIRNRKHATSPYLTAALMAAAAVPALTGVAQAQETQDKTLQGVTVTAEEDTYKADVVSSPKQTQALVNTPQTIQVIRKEVIQEQQAATLMDALRNTPGITMQMGENGNSSSGDTFQMRGFDTSSSLLVDGLRDKSAITRDTFNIEQIEVVKGPGGADSGRGSSSGYVNVSTKQASLDDAASASVGAYSQGGARATVDVNRAIGDTSALRVNLMTQDIDTAGRDQVNRAGYGAAVAYGVGLETNTRFHLSGQYINFDNLPDGGISTIGYDGYYDAVPEIAAGQRVRRENFYGSRNDFEKQEQGSVTAKFEHDFAAGLYFTNLSRWSNSSLERVMTGITRVVAPDVADPSTWGLTRSRQRVNQKTEAFNNISNFTTNFATGAVTHDLVFGFEYSDEKQNNGVFSSDGLTTDPANLYHPDAGDVMHTPYFNGWTEAHTKVASAYVFDTLSLGEKWLINLGYRADSYRLDARVFDATSAQTGLIKTSKSLSAYKAGVVYKPVENGSLYVAYATTQTPPGNGGTLNITPDNINNPNVDPTETENLEVGAKWDFLEGRLGLSGAWYQTKYTNWVVGDTDGDGISENYGDREIKGFEFGLVGKITDRWDITAGIQTMEDEVQNGGVAGATSRWSPELSASFWSTYQVSNRLKLGGGARYTGEQKRDLTVGELPATALMPVIDAYWVVDAYGAYDLTDKASLQLNIYNLFDEDYIGKMNNHGWRLDPGAPRSATVTLNYRF